ncbi:MAG: flagellar basal body P-ring protein FlgI [Phycisphaerales bacterium]|nr:flagellar basal body P-ring protein FlgI [Phycisphaerales bacterium]MCB9862534.1 flagellar basal body P-ring protein FlgI [Phycisphaerales bacterium]
MVIAAAMLCGTTSAVAQTTIADVTHLKGRRVNTLTGYGLVVGINGTGDGAKYAPTIRAMVAMLSKFNIPVAVDELSKSKNIALVWVDVTLPENGVREGDRVDVKVSAVGDAKSLMGGRLVTTPLQGPGLDAIFAFAQGAVRVSDPKSAATTGTIVNGAVMEEDIIHNYINELGQITLVVEDVHASHALASVIEQTINEDVSEIGQIRRIAMAQGPKNILVQIPPEYFSNPVGFIGRIEGLEMLMPRSESRIVINRRTETITIGAGVEIAPTVIVHEGMTITTATPEPVPTPDEPRIDVERAVGITTTESNGTKLRELVRRLNLLNVPAKDIIAIIENLYANGQIRGKLVIRD